MQTKLRFLASSLVAALVGWWLFPTLIVYGMLYVSRWSPIPSFLRLLGISGSNLVQTLFVIDFITWLILAIPTAIVLNWLKPRRLLWYTALATVPFSSWLVVTTSGGAAQATYVVTWLLVPSVAVAVIAWISHRVRGEFNHQVQQSGNKL